MGFRNPATTATAVDTGRGLANAGVRLYQDTAGALPRGIAEWRTGLMDRNAQVYLSGGTGGSAFVIDGGATQGRSAPTLQLNVESAPASGYWSVARITGADFLALPGDAADTSVAYGAGVTAYTDATGWNGLRCWKRSGVVTVSGAIKLTATVANNGVIATLPAGFAPPEKVQRNVDNSTAITVTVLSNGTITLSPSQGAGFVTSFELTFAVLT